MKGLAEHYEKDIYAVSDAGVILIDRKNNEFEIFGNVEKIDINNSY